VKGTYLVRMSPDVHDQFDLHYIDDDAGGKTFLNHEATFFVGGTSNKT
jgi:hypothetical protein